LIRHLLLNDNFYILSVFKDEMNLRLRSLTLPSFSQRVELILDILRLIICDNE
jgi:hypothetical protein